MEERRCRFFPVGLFFSNGTALRDFVARSHDAITAFRAVPELQNAVRNSVSRGWMVVLVVDARACEIVDFTETRAALCLLMTERFGVPRDSAKALLLVPNQTVEQIWDFARRFGVSLSRSEFVVPPDGRVSFEGDFRNAGVRTMVPLADIGAR